MKCEDPHPSFDIWSLGITLYNLMEKEKYYEKIDAEPRYKHIFQYNKRERLPEFYSKELRDLVDYLLTLDC